ncbi:MAG: DNA polymerase IV [Betaproteobacteria bacterium]|nr:DNA polymerase IV [Betaproteobacteria bacterium]
MGADSNQSVKRRIAHLDMDAFYASVELLRYPQLKGLPVVIGGARARARVTPEQPVAEFPRLRDYAGRGVATTATYEARALGVHSAMGLMKAAALAPHAILLPADFDEYRRFSRLFKAAVAQVAPHIEDRGIDEIYIDLTEVGGDTVKLAQRIKDSVRAATGLSCSIGVTPNKLLSKIASELDKPDGLTVLGHDDLAVRIWPLEVRKINGVGPRASEKLEALGIHNIGQLAAAPIEVLAAHFGRRQSRWLLDAAHGRDDRPVVMQSEPKSISRETTFERDLHPVADRAALSTILLDLCERLSADLARKGYAAKTIGVKLRHADFRIVTRDTTMDTPTRDAQRIRSAARECLRRVALGQRLRLLGVRASSLVPEQHMQVPAQAERSGSLFG